MTKRKEGRGWGAGSVLNRWESEGRTGSKATLFPPRTGRAIAIFLATKALVRATTTGRTGFADTGNADTTGTAVRALGAIGVCGTSIGTLTTATIGCTDFGGRSRDRKTGGAAIGAGRTISVGAAIVGTGRAATTGSAHFADTGDAGATGATVWTLGAVAVCGASVGALHRPAGAFALELLARKVGTAWFALIGVQTKARTLGSRRLFADSLLALVTLSTRIALQIQGTLARTLGLTAGFFALEVVTNEASTTGFALIR